MRAAMRPVMMAVATTSSGPGVMARPARGRL
jgi:hypothetical protein